MTFHVDRQPGPGRGGAIGGRRRSERDGRDQSFIDPSVQRGQCDEQLSGVARVQRGSDHVLVTGETGRQLGRQP